MSFPREVVGAWASVIHDCGCPDLYFCPASGDVECPVHSGFNVCCDPLDEHVPVPSDLRVAEPKPPIPPEDLQLA